MMPYRVAIVTDLHIDNKDKMNFGIDAKSNLLLLLEDIKKQQIQHLIILGDLCNMDPKIYIYKWIKDQLNKYNFTFNIIPGNHDDPLMLKEVFGLKNSFFSMKEWGRKVLFLNTSNNSLPIEQLDWIKNELELCDKEVIIFMHHPPTLLNCNMMDSNYPLQNIDQTQELFMNLGKELTVFCGHYHDEVEFQYNNQHIFLTPSNVFQIDEVIQEFTIKTFNPGWRFVEFKKDIIKTKVNYINIGRVK